MHHYSTPYKLLSKALSNPGKISRFLSIKNNPVNQSFKSNAIFNNTLAFGESQSIVNQLKGLVDKRDEASQIKFMNLTGQLQKLNPEASFHFNTGEKKQYKPFTEKGYDSSLRIGDPNQYNVPHNVTDNKTGQYVMKSTPPLAKYMKGMYPNMVDVNLTGRMPLNMHQNSVGTPYYSEMGENLRQYGDFGMTVQGLKSTDKNSLLDFSISRAPFGQIKSNYNGELGNEHNFLQHHGSPFVIESPSSKKLSENNGIWSNSALSGLKMNPTLMETDPNFKGTFMKFINRKDIPEERFTNAAKNSKKEYKSLIKQESGPMYKLDYKLSDIFTKPAEFYPIRKKEGGELSKKKHGGNHLEGTNYNLSKKMYNTKAQKYRRFKKGGQVLDVYQTKGEKNRKGDGKQGGTIYDMYDFETNQYKNGWNQNNVSNWRSTGGYSYKDLENYYNMTQKIPEGVDIMNRSSWEGKNFGVNKDFSGTYGDNNDPLFRWYPQDKNQGYAMSRDLGLANYWHKGIPYNTESGSEQDLRLGNVSGDQINSFQEQIKNVKTKGELKEIIENFSGNVDQQSMMYIINQANQNNNVDISQKDLLDVLTKVDEHRTTNKANYTTTYVNDGQTSARSMFMSPKNQEKWYDDNVKKYGEDNFKKMLSSGEITPPFYMNNPYNYNQYSIENPKAKYETHGPNGKPWMPGTGWIANFDNYFRDDKINVDEDGQKLVQPTELWDPNANNGEGGYVSITKGTLTNRINEGEKNERIYIGEILQEKGLIPEGATTKEADKIIDQFVGGSGNFLNKYINNSANNNLNFNEGALSTPTFQESSNSNPNQIIDSKEDALNSMKLRSHYQGVDNLPSEVYGNKTGTYNPNVEGVYYEGPDGENVWVDNPEYNSKFSKSVRGDFKGGFNKNYESWGDYMTDAPISSTLGHIMSNNDVQWAMDNPMQAFGPLGADAKILTSVLPALGTMWNMSKTKAFMNTPFTSAAITPWQGVNTYWGASMASQVPTNLSNKNYGMAGLNALFGFGTGKSVYKGLQNKVNLFPKYTYPNTTNLNRTDQFNMAVGEYSNLQRTKPLWSLSGKPNQITEYKNLLNTLNNKNVILK